MHRMVFTQIFRWLTVIMGGCLVTGCITYRTLRIETLEPSQIMLEKEGRLAFLNRNLLYRPDSLANAAVRKAYSYPNVSTVFSNGLNEGLAFAEPVDTVIVIEGMEKMYCKDSLPQPLDPVIVTKICSKFSIAYLISLESHFHQPVNKGYYEWFVRLYDSQGVIVDSVRMRKEMQYKRNTVALKDEILMKSWDNGKEYAGRITPHWKETERRIYRTGEMLRLGYLYYQLGQMEEALKTWSVAQQFSTGESIRAAINIACLYENTEDMESAARILRETLQMAEEKEIVDKDVAYLKKYLKIIEKRIENIELLNYQIK